MTIRSTYSLSSTQPTAQKKITYPINNSSNAYYITFTSTTFQAFNPATGIATSVPQPYTKSGNTLTYAPTIPGSTTHTETITQLTATELTIISTEQAAAPSTDYTTYESHYTRR